MTFEEFVAARLPALLRYATVLAADPHDAEDIVQEVLLRAQERWSRIGDLDVPEAYVLRMIANELVSVRRRLAARLRRERMTVPQPVPDRSGEVVGRDALVRLIRTLPPRQRVVVALRYVEDLAARRRVTSQRRMVLRLAGAGAATVVVGGAVAYARAGGRQPAAPEPERQGDTVALHTMLGWLPVDFTPTQLEVGVGGATCPEEMRRLYTARTWFNPGGNVTLTELTAAEVARPANATTVDVGGVGAVLVAGPGGTVLTWRPPGGPMVRLLARQGGDGDPATDRALAVRIAQGLTMSPGRFVAPRLDRLPAGVDGSTWYDLYLVQETTVGQWTASLDDALSSMAVDLGAYPLDTVGDPIVRTVQVRGRDGYVTRSGALGVHLADGWWLRVQVDGPDAPVLPFDTVRAVAEGMRLAPPLDPSVF